MNTSSNYTIWMIADVPLIIGFDMPVIALFELIMYGQH